MPGVMPSMEEAGRVLQSSLAQGYSMSQTIPGQRLHAVMEHEWHVSGSNERQSRMGEQTDGQTNLCINTHTQSCTKEKQRRVRVVAHLKRMRSNISQHHRHIQALSLARCIRPEASHASYFLKYSKCSWQMKHVKLWELLLMTKSVYWLQHLQCH